MLGSSKTGGVESEIYRGLDRYSGRGLVVDVRNYPVPIGTII